MANPNIVNVTSIQGKTAVATATTSPVALVSNANSSDTILKIDSVLASNTSASPVTVTVDLYRSATSKVIAPTITVPANSLLVVIGKDSSFYLEEGDALRISAGSNSAINVMACYEIIT